MAPPRRSGNDFDTFAERLAAMETKQEWVEDRLGKIDDKLESLPSKVSEEVFKGLQTYMELQQSQCAIRRNKEYAELRDATVDQSRKEWRAEIAQLPSASVIKNAEAASATGNSNGKKDWSNIHYALGLALVTALSLAVAAYKGHDTHQQPKDKVVPISQPLLPNP